MRSCLALSLLALILTSPDLWGQVVPAAQAPSLGVGNVRSLVISQQANGLPNQPTKEKVFQRMQVTKDHLRLDDLQGGVIYLLELVDGEPRLKEVSADGKHYREDGELGELQKSRDRSERQTLERLKGRPELERKEVMAAQYLRPGLEREVIVERTGEKKVILERTSERVLVKENGRTIVNVWLAPSEGIDIPFFQFYSKLGAFSKEVLPKLAELKGLPLQVDFTVVTAILAYNISVTAIDVSVMEVPLAEYRVPATAKLVERETMATCPICGQQVEIANAKQSRRSDGSSVYFDSKECTAEFNRRTYPERFPPQNKEPKKK